MGALGDVDRFLGSSNETVSKPLKIASALPGYGSAKGLALCSHPCPAGTGSTSRRDHEVRVLPGQRPARLCIPSCGNTNNLGAERADWLSPPPSCDTLLDPDGLNVWRG